MKHIFRHLWLQTLDTWNVFVAELRRIFRDPGVMVIFLLATLAYPIIYKAIYWNEQIADIPVAVVDMSHSPQSREFIHKWNAAPEVKVVYSCTSMAEAEQLLRDQKIHGILYVPHDFTAQLADPFGQAHLSLYCDMSSFLYMKGVFLSCNMVMLEAMNNIEIDRYEQMGTGKELAWSLVQDAPYSETALFTPTGGYGSFLIPAVLVMILHQTLLFGICMLGGTAREENKELYRLPWRRRGYSVFRLVLGRSAAYFLIYYALSAILLIAMPRIFNLPHIGQVGDLLRFIVPFLLATIFFSMSVSVFIHNRETGMVLLISTSLIFLFIAGISWPKELIPDAWRYLSYVIPYTTGTHGFIHINSMGATLWTTRTEYITLWILSGAYFLITCLLFFFIGRYKERK